MKRFFTAILLTLAFSLPVLAAKNPHYQYYRIGLEDISTQTTRGTVLMGGAAYVDDAFKWMCLLSGKGDFLVLRARGKDDDNAYIKNLCPDQNSVATLIIPSVDAANEDAVAAIINNAEAIFIEGGDQSDYIKYWTGSKAHIALQQRASQGIPIGGISAGLDVLTQFVYSALLSKGAASSEALADPFNKYMTFDNTFDLKLPFLEGVISDAHVVVRDRMGRDVAFLCRVYDAGWLSHPRGISVDEKTALLIDENGKSTVVGDSNAYFLQAPGAPEVCQSGSPLTYRNISVYRINARAGSFDLWSWTGFNGSEYHVSAVEGGLISDQANGSLY